MGWYLGIDLGTSYFKVGLFGPDGELRGLGRVAVAPETPAAGRVELPAAEFWARLREATQAALAEARADASEIVAISYSSQANTFLLLDGEGRELTPLVFWHDQRARPLDEDLEAFGRSPEHGPATGLMGVVAERAPAKCRWFARHEPALWEKARYVMTIADYLTWGLTGVRWGDASTAALTGLYSLSEGKWWEPALARFGLSAEQLSTPQPPGTLAGRTHAAAGRLGLPEGIPFVVGALDHHAAALGAGLGGFADASLSTGTVLAALILVDRVEPAPGRLHGPHGSGRFFRLAFDPAGAGQLEDYQRRAAPELDIPELLRRAAQAEGTGPVPAHGREVRALLEKIARTQNELLDHIADGAPIRRVTATGGGARNPIWLQLTADVTGREILAVDSPERACLGAAMLAAVGAGFWPDLEAAARHMVRVPREYRPRGLRR